MKFKDKKIKHSRQLRNIKCIDCSIVADNVYKSNKYNVNLCVPCLMIRIKKDIKKD